MYRLSFIIYYDVMSKTDMVTGKSGEILQDRPDLGLRQNFSSCQEMMASGERDVGRSRQPDVN